MTSKTTNPGVIQRIEHVLTALKDDGFDALANARIALHDDFIGVVAEHETATIGTSARRKKAVYVEGSPYAMGYLVGVLAESDVSRMCHEFSENVVLDFVGVNLPDALAGTIGKMLKACVERLAADMPHDVPDAVNEEIRGLLDGCQAANPKTRVTEHDLRILNFGVDALLAVVYTGRLPEWSILEEPPKPEDFRIPLMCNGFSVSGSLVADGGHLMGRDFMFATADVFQETACHIVRLPAKGHPTVSVSAPGLVGSMTAMNSRGLAAGVNMEPSGACDPDHPGFNSLLMVRHCVEHGDSCEGAVRIMEGARRGVSWGYLVADGRTGRSCAVEAGRFTDAIDFLSFPPEALTDLLPDRAFLEQHPTTALRNGLMVRWNDTRIPPEYGGYNRRLFEKQKKRYDDAAFGPDGYINDSYHARNCPKSNYFAPQRETTEELLVLSNHFLIPEMRLTAMNPWTSALASGYWDDIQWRYDELCHRLRKATENGGLTPEAAWDAINFLSPKGDFPKYYNRDGKKKPEEVQVRGAVSLLDLKALVITTLCGYYSDSPTSISLGRYVGLGPDRGNGAQATGGSARRGSPAP